jgi:hypothetical protein
LIRFGDFFVGGSEKDGSVSLFLSLSLSLSRFPPSLRGWQAVRVCMCASVVSFGDFGFYFDLCSLGHIRPSVSDCFSARPWWGAVGVWGRDGCLLPVNEFVSFCLLVGKTHAHASVVVLERSRNEYDV